MMLINYECSLNDVLFSLGVVASGRDENGRKNWSTDSITLGEFDVHEGWAVIRAYEEFGNWSEAVRVGIKRFYTT